MSKHAKVWTQKKQELSRKEQELKQELESVSTLFEGRAKMILLISLATGGLFLIIYLILRLFKKPKPTAREAAPKKTRSTKRTVMRTLITERILNAVLAYAGQQLNQIMTGRNRDKDQD